MSSRDNVRDLWDQSPFDSLFTVTAQPGNVGSVGVTDASEDATALQGIEYNPMTGDGGVLQKPIGNSKMDKEWLQRKVGYLYAIQGAQVQHDFKIRPKKHQIVEGVVDPKSYADAERQKKAYRQMVEEEKKKRKAEAEKKKKEEEEKKAKEDSEKRKKEEELRKSEEEKKQQREKQEQEEATKKAQEEKRQKQAKADEEGIANDNVFLLKDMASHLNVDTKFPKYSGGEGEKLFVVTPMNDTIPVEKRNDIMANRNAYCSKNGYICLFPNVNFGDVTPKYKKWSSVHLLRDYFMKTSDIKANDWVWFVKPEIVITNLDKSISNILLQPDSLKARLSYGSRFISGRGHFHPTVRFPDSVEDASKFEMIISRGPKSFNFESFLIRNTERTKFWLDMWDDHLVSSVSESDATMQGDVLQYLYLHHSTLRNLVGVVTPRLLMSRTAGGAADYLMWTPKDLAALYECIGGEEVCGPQWTKLLGDSKSEAVKAEALKAKSEKTEAKSEVKSEVKSGAKSEVKTESTYSEAKSELKPETKSIDPKELAAGEPAQKTEKEVEAVQLIEASKQAEKKQREANKIEQIKEVAKEASAWFLQDFVSL